MKRALVMIAIWAVCNQLIYDEIYAAIVQRALKSELTKPSLDDRADAIEKLRALCLGQLSSWEKGEKK